MDPSAGTLTPPKALSDSNARSSSRAPSAARRQETDDSDKAGRVWARQPEDDPWAPCILALDGGGIRGYSSLLILRELMHQIWIWENVLIDEERSGRQQQSGDEILEGLDGDQAASGAWNPASLHRGRSPLSREVNGDTEEFGSSTEFSMEPQRLQQNESSVDHVEQSTHATTATTREVITEDDLLPCHYFDFMYGTSTGGLIATILGRLRMTVPEGLELYRKVGEDLFGKRRSHVPLMTKYHHEPLERAVRDIVGSRCHEHAKCDGNDLHPWEPDRVDKVTNKPIPFNIDEPRVCQSCCLTAVHDGNINEAYLLRSYAHYYTENSPNWVSPYNEGADPLSIWECTRATSAAPFYFKMLKADVYGEMTSFKDGGIRENNPSGAALSEFHALYHGRVKLPAVMLSVGTGIPDMSADGFAHSWSGPLGRLPFISKFLEKRAIIQNLLIKYTAGEKQHHNLREYAHGEHTWYKRLNVSEGLQDMPLDDWVKGDWHEQSDVPGGVTLTRMEEATTAYLEREFDARVDTYAPPSTMLRQTAEKLVRQRRARELEGGVRWETFIGKYLHPKPANGTPG